MRGALGATLRGTSRRCTRRAGSLGRRSGVGQVGCAGLGAPTPLALPNAVWMCMYGCMYVCMRCGCAAIRPACKQHPPVPPRARSPVRTPTTRAAQCAPQCCAQPSAHPIVARSPVPTPMSRAAQYAPQCCARRLLLQHLLAHAQRLAPKVGAAQVIACVSMFSCAQGCGCPSKVPHAFQHTRSQVCPSAQGVSQECPG